MNNRTLTRRTVVRGAAWSAPAVALVTTAPAMAASPARDCALGAYAQYTGNGNQSFVVDGNQSTNTLDLLFNTVGDAPTGTTVITQTIITPDGTTGVPTVDYAIGAPMVTTNAPGVTVSAPVVVDYDGGQAWQYTITVDNTAVPSSGGFTVQYQEVVDTTFPVGVTTVVTDYTDQTGCVYPSDTQTFAREGKIRQ